MTREAEVRAWFVAVGLLLAAGPAAADGKCHGASGAVHAYVQCVQEGRWEAARACWSPTFLAFAERHGVVPRTTPGWWDVASPVVGLRDELAADRAVCRVRARSDPEGAVATVTVVTAVDSISFTYAVVHEAGDWLLAGRTWGAARRWPTLQTRYFRIRHPAGHVVDPAAMAELDAFAAETVAKLGGDPSELARVPAPYVVADAATVEEVTGHATVGMVDVASGTIVSSHFPHFHEAVHLLAGRVGPDLPMMQLPVFQEGLACLLGGRWGRSPAVVLHQGRVFLDWETLAPSDLLAAADFRRAPGGPDAAYAVAALVCATVEREAGLEQLLALNREFAGPAAAASAETVAAAVARACAWPTSDDPRERLDMAVHELAREWRYCGIVPDRGDPPAPPGIADGGSPWRVRVAGDEDGPTVLFWGEPDADPAARASSVFTERIPGRIWSGRRWGLTCTPTSVSLYDFAANRLHGVWVADFTGDDPLVAGDMRLLLLEPPAEPATHLVVHRPGDRP